MFVLCCVMTMSLHHNLISTQGDGMPPKRTQIKWRGLIQGLRRGRLLQACVNAATGQVGVWIFVLRSIEPVIVSGFDLNMCCPVFIYTIVQCYLCGGAAKILPLYSLQAVKSDQKGRK